ncbi:GntR family transcriptional regulator [Streptomyces sp. NBC_00257]|uniref:GntR family transcriptional regulator n=1 Tax=unclassified Streptomyces TaxID=2593676 RepID=UPI0022502AFE|nr:MULTISPECIES: GntR family transcriptional regulator [unclassified Streptomyces]MCX5431888.1 GntR family transcriptional regulator [Streptomyces sp. NBC_00062]
MSNRGHRAGKAAVYRLYDADGTLLYVGMSGDPTKRFLGHRADKPWWPEVHAHTLQWFNSRGDASAAERDAITGERPRYNKAHNETLDDVQATIYSKREIFERGFSDYRPLAVLIEDEIGEGVWPADARLPTSRVLMQRYRVSAATLQRAMLLLQERGVVRNAKTGYVVACPEDRLIAVPVGRPEEAAAILRSMLTDQDRLELVELLSP